MPVVCDDVAIIGLEIDRDDGVAEIDLSREMFGENWPGGSLAGTVFIQAVTRTAAQFPEVDAVIVLVEGEYWDDGHFIWDQPQTPEEENEMLPAEIETWVEYSREIMLAQAREYEGTVLYRLTDGAGNELAGGIATGHGHNWGYFTVDLTVPEEVESGEKLIVELYSESPADGSVENLVELELVVD